MQRHEALEPADARAAYVQGRRSRRAAEDGRGGVPLLLVVVMISRGEGGDLFFLQFDDGGVDADGGEEALHDVAHAAGGAAEDDHRILRDEALDAHLGGLGHVDGEGGDGGGGELEAEAAVVERVVAADALHRHH